MDACKLPLIVKNIKNKNAIQHFKDLFLNAPDGSLKCRIRQVFDGIDSVLKYIFEGILTFFMNHVEMAVITSMVLGYAIVTITTNMATTECVKREPNITIGEKYNPDDACLYNYKNEKITERMDTKKTTKETLKMMYSAILQPLTLFVMPQLVMQYGMERVLKNDTIPRTIAVAMGDSSIDNLKSAIQYLKNPIKNVATEATNAAIKQVPFVG